MKRDDNPRVKAATLHLAATFRSKQDWAGLQQHIEQAARDHDLAAEERVQWIIAIAHQDRLAEALSLLTDGFLADARIRQIVRGHGVQPALQQGRAELAIALARRLADTAPDDAGALVLLGKTLSSAERHEEATDCFDRAGALQPYDLDTATRRIVARLRTGRNEEAAGIARSVPQGGHSDRFQLYCLTAFMRGGDREAAARLVDTLTARDEVDLELIVLAARWLMREGRGPEALDFCQKALAAGRTSPHLHLVTGEALLLGGRSKEGAVQLDRADSLESEAPETLIQRIRATLRAGQIEDAVVLARQAIGLCGTHERLARICLTTFLRGADARSAATVAETLIDKGTRDPDLAVLAIRGLLLASRANDAVAFAERLFAEHVSSGRLRLAAARAMFAAGRPFDAILPHVEAARDEGRDDPAVLHALGKVSLGLGRYEDAVSALKKAATAGGGNMFLMAKALKHARRYQEAADVMMDGAEQHGETRNWRRQATAALTLAGRNDQAAAVYQGLVAERRSKLAKTFGAHLESVTHAPLPEPIPQARVDWAWAAVKRLEGKAPSADRAGWERKALWGFKADRAILDWVECRPDAIHEVAERLRHYETGGRLLRELLAQKRGLFIASAHIGMMYAGPVVLQTANVPFKVVAQMPRVSSATYAAQLISTFDQSRVAVIRQIVDALRDNKAVTITVDASMNAVGSRVPWQGVQVTYTDVVSTLSYRRQVPSVFAQPYWQDEQINFVVRQLPFPSVGEAEPAFAARWRDAYFNELLDFFRRGPENLRLAEGIWRTIPS